MKWGMQIIIGGCDVSPIINGNANDPSRGQVQHNAKSIMHEGKTLMDISRTMDSLI